MTERRLSEAIASHASEKITLELARDAAVAEKDRVEAELQASRQAQEAALEGQRATAEALELMTKERDDSKAEADRVVGELATVGAALVQAEQRASAMASSTYVSRLQAELSAETAALTASRAEVSRLRAESVYHAVQLASLGASAATRLLTLQTDITTAVQDCISRAVTDVRRFGTSNSSGSSGRTEDDDGEPDAKRLRTA